MLAREVVLVDVGLQLVGREHHDDVGPLGGVGDLHHLEAFLLGLLGAGRALAQRDGDVLDAGIAQVQRVRVALAAIADDGDFLGLDEVDVGITIVIDAHGSLLRLGSLGHSVSGGAGGEPALREAGGTYYQARGNANELELL